MQDRNPPEPKPKTEEDIRIHMGIKYLKSREYLPPRVRRVSMKEFKEFPNDDYGDEDSRVGQGDGKAEKDKGEELDKIEDKGKHLKKLAKRKAEILRKPRKKRDE